MTLDFVDDILLEETNQRMAQSYLSKKVLSYVTVEDGYVLPYRGVMPDVITGGVMTKEKKFIRQSSVNETIVGSYSFEEYEVKESNKTIIFLGFFLPVWGHCITDCLKKMWFLQTEEGKKLLNEGAQLLYIKTPGSLPSSFYEILNALGVEGTFLLESQAITRFKKIIIPDDSLYREENNLNVLYFTKEFKDTIIRIKKNIELVNDVPKYEKIYFSRYRIRGCRDYGEKRIEDVFKYLGYKIIYPERLTFKEQFSLLSQCRYFASTEGSTSHNSMFCQEGTVVTLLRKVAYLNEYQFMINQLSGLNVTYVDTHLSICLDKNKLWFGPFFMYVNDNLLKYANIPKVFNNFSLKAFKKYAKRGYALHHNEIPYSECYASRLLEEMNTSYFCKNWIKRVLRYVLSHGNLSVLIPLYKKVMKNL